MDHNHITGLFRAIVCRGCNSCDRYIKYPDGYDKKIYDKKYREENKEKVAKKHKKYYEANKENKFKKYTCDCGGKYTHCQKQRHLRTIKHTAWFMEQVD